jgi:hypothetical protein
MDKACGRVKGRRVIKPNMPKPHDERAQRLSDALRANLRKRKQGQHQPDGSDRRGELEKQEQPTLNPSQKR